MFAQLMGSTGSFPGESRYWAKVGLYLGDIGSFEEDAVDWH